MAKTSPSRRGRAKNGADSVIDGSIEIERAKDGLSAKLLFNTFYAVSCKITYYQDTGTVPEPSTMVWTPCLSPQPGRAFTETVSSLKPELFYVFAVKMWGQGQSEDSAIIKTVRENSAPGDASTRYVLRLDVPTKSAQIESFSSPTDLETMHKDFLTPFACKVADNSRSLPGTSLTGIPIKRITSRGFFSGISFLSDDLPDGLLINGASITSTASEWTINVQSKDTSGTVRIAVPALFKEVSASQSTSTVLTNQVLEDSELPAFKISTAAAVNLVWSADRAAESSIVVALLTNSDTGLGISCGFEAKSGRGAIPPDMLGKIGAGKGFLTIRLENQQMPVKDRWLTRAVDWRMIQVQL